MKLLSGVLLLLARGALAAGIEFPDNGATAMGRGGAFAARADDPTAIYYNPAGLSRQKGFFFLLDNRLAVNEVSFQRTDERGNAWQAPAGNPDGVQHTWDEVHNEAPPFYAPFAVVGWQPAALAQLTMALGVYGPSSIGVRKFPDPRDIETGGRADYPLIAQRAPQRYLFIASDTTIAYPTLAGAWRFADALAVGVSLQAAFAHVVNVNSIYAFPGTRPTPDQADFDAVVTLDVTDTFTPTAILGLLWSPTRRLDVGLSFRPPLEFVGDGTLKVDLADTLTDLAEVRGDRAALHLKMPAVARLGFRYRSEAEGAWDLELDAVWEAWSGLDHILVKPKGIKTVLKTTGTESALDLISIPKGYQDSVSLRLGGETSVARWVGVPAAVRAGYFYETSAVPVENTSIDFPNYARHAVTAGAGVALWGLTATFSYTHIFRSTVEVLDSHVTESVIGHSVAPQVVGNGIFQSSYDLYALALSGQFGGSAP